MGEQKEGTLFARELARCKAKKGVPCTGSPRIVYSDLPVRPALPGLARQCPDLRVKPTRFQAYSSRAGTLEGSRLVKHKLPQTTTTTTITTTTTTTTTTIAM